MTAYRFIYRELTSRGRYALPAMTAYHTAESAQQFMGRLNKRDHGIRHWETELCHPCDFDHPMREKENEHPF